MKIKDTIAEEFSEFSKNYTQDMIGCVPHYLTLMESFTKNLQENFYPKRILDLGCGNGNVTATLVKKFPDAEYTLLDASQEMLRLCKQQFKKQNVNYIESYFQDYTFQKGYFDLIVAGFSLHHCNSEEKRKLFNEIYYTLNTGGVFSCADLMLSKNNSHHPTLLKEWKAFVEANFPDGEKWKWLQEHYQEFDKPDDYQNQISWLKNAGFNTVEITTKKGYWIHLQAIKN